jgi:hypothetical protein
VRELDHLASSLNGVAGYIVTDLTTNKRVAARLERERDRLPLQTVCAFRESSSTVAREFA